MLQAILISILCGFVSAVLSGLFGQGSMLAALLFFVAPLPLMIAGLGWHPLIAALGALVGCLAMSFGLGSKAGLFFAAVVGLPSWLSCEVVLRLMVNRPADENARDYGLRLGVGIVGGIALYAVPVTLVGALAMNISYDSFNSVLRAFAEAAIRLLIESGHLQKEGIDVKSTAAIYATVMPTVIIFLVCITLVLSLYIAVRVVRKSERLPFVPGPLFLVALPKESLFVMVGSIGLATMTGWLGFIGACAVAALTFCFILTGLAVMHSKTLGRSDRGMILGAAWGSMLVFGLPALVFALIGAADAAFDLRRLSGGSSKTPNP